MPSTLDRFQSDVARLEKTGREMLLALFKQRRDDADPDANSSSSFGVFETGYQSWYSEAHELVRQLLPNRLDDFERLYHDQRKVKHPGETFGIREWLIGERSPVDRFSKKKIFDDLASVIMKFKNQVDIVTSCKARLQSSVFQIRALVQADLFDSELDAARELVRNGFYRAAGAVAGVVIEHHLSEVCTSHKIALRAKNATIATLNDALKDAGVIDVPTWRFVQRLGDLRNLCDHKKSVEPTKDDVTELIAGTDKITKTIA